MAPTLALIPGFCTLGSAAYAPLKEALVAQGYSGNSIHIIDLPSVDSVNTVETLTPNPHHADINYIHSELEKLVEAGEDVVIVLHSYGGTAGLYGADGLWKHLRESKGEKGGVVKAMLISASLTMPGLPIQGMRAEWAKANNVDLDPKDPTGMQIEMHGGMPYLYPTPMLATGFMLDMSDAEREAWTSKCLRPTPLAATMSPTPADATIRDWRIGSYLLTSEQDPAMPEAFQQFLVDNAKANGVVIEGVERIKSGHFPQITHAEEVAKWIKGAIGS